MVCGPHREGVPARGVPVTHSQTRLPLETAPCGFRLPGVTNYSICRWPPRITNMICGPHREGTAARNVFAMHLCEAPARGVPRKAPNRLKEAAGGATMR
eukprot:4013245-Pyramimonas_sp.AAC.1